MIKVNPFETYKSYLGLKNHFTQKKYDYKRYCGRSRASLNAFYKRKDRMFFEKLSRQKNDEEVVDFFVSNFISCDDPQSLWIGDIMRNGEGNYTNWKKKIQSLSYVFKSEVENLFSGKNFDSMFKIEKSKHPPILKSYLNNEVSLETLIILESILGFKKNFDKKLEDPVWESISMRMEKYSSFINIDVFKYKKILKDVVF